MTSGAGVPGMGDSVYDEVEIEDMEFNKVGVRCIAGGCALGRASERASVCGCARA